MSKDVVKLALDIYRNSVTEYSKESANEVLRKAFLEIAGTDKIDYKTMRRFKPELFEVIEVALDQLIVEGLEDQFNDFVEIRNLGWGDTNVFQIEDPNMFRVATIADGTNNLRRQRLDNGSLTVSTSTKGVKIYEELYRFLAGRIDWNKLVAKVAKSYNNQISGDIYNAVYNSYTGLSATYGVTGSYAEATLNTLIGHVEAATGYEATIFGTKTALSKISTAVVSEKLKEKYNEQGFYGVVNGTEMRMVKQSHSPGTESFAINDSFVMIIPKVPDKMIKLVVEGDALIEEKTTGNADMSMEYTFIKKAGIAVLKSSKYGIYRLI